MFVGPPPSVPSNYRNMQPPPRYEEEIAAAAGSMSTPIGLTSVHLKAPGLIDSFTLVIALLLSVFLFSLCLIFFFSPACTHRERPPMPIDLEDAYFIDENTKRRLPSFARTSAYNSIAMEYPQKKLNHPKNTYFSFPPPPPAYTSRPGSPALSSDDWSFNSLLGRVSSRKSDFPAKSSNGFRFLKLSIPAFFYRSYRTPSTPISISKPMPQPEVPLPGPDILAESDIQKQVLDTTVIRPCIGKSVSEHILHPSTSDLHMPSRAHVYDRDTFSVAQQNSHYLTAVHSQRSSTRLSGTQSHGSISSVTSSMIGIAF